MKNLYSLFLLAVVCSAGNTANAQYGIANYYGGSGTSTATVCDAGAIISPLQNVGFGSVAPFCTTGGISSLTEATSWTAFSTAGPHLYVKMKPTPGHQLYITSFQTATNRMTGGPSAMRFAVSFDNGATWAHDSVHAIGPPTSCGVGTLHAFNGGIFPITITDTVNGIIIAEFPFGSTSSTAPIQLNSIRVFGGVYCTQPVITAHSVATTPDTVCSGAKFSVTSCGDSASALHVTTYFGDGSSGSMALSTYSTSGSSGSIYHTYAMPGTYTIHQVLYSGTTAVDSVTYSYEDRNCATFPAKFYYDANSNCVYDAGDTRFLQPVRLAVDSNGVTIDTISCGGGYYYRAFGAPIGTIYTFHIVSLPTGMMAACPSGGSWNDTVTMLVNNYPNQYIGVRCTSTTAHDLSVHTTRPLTGRFDQSGNIYVRNTSCTPVDAVVTLHFSPKWHFTGVAYPAAFSSTATSITWHIPGINANTSVAPYHISYELFANPATGPLTVGDTVHTHAEVTPTTGDANPSDNDEFVIDTVSSSFDPNAIWVSPQGMILSGTQLQYTINFENTGNDTANNIYVLDTLSDKLDYKTLNIVSASDELNTTLIKSGGYNIMKFDFPQINLLDSSHHGLCDGAVIYTIKTLAGLPDGTIIPNRAGIYFDNNEVVMTNEVHNIIGSPTAIVDVNQEPNVAVFPNPATDKLVVRTEEGAYRFFTITNAVGQSLIVKDISSRETVTDVSSIRAGLYYISLKGDNGTRTFKFIKM